MIDGGLYPADDQSARPAACPPSEPFLRRASGRPPPLPAVPNTAGSDAVQSAADPSVSPARQQCAAIETQWRNRPRERTRQSAERGRTRPPPQPHGCRKSDGRSRIPDIARRFRRATGPTKYTGVPNPALSNMQARATEPAMQKPTPPKDGAVSTAGFLVPPPCPLCSVPFIRTNRR